MPTLPDFTALGQRDPVASRGVAVTPTSPVGDALAGFGNSLSKTGFSLAGTERDKSETDQKFAAETAFIKFQDGQSQELDALQRAAPPGAAGVADTARVNFKRNADAFISTIPENLRREYGPKLARLEMGVGTQARNFEIDAGMQASKNIVDDHLGDITNRFAGAGDADTIKGVLREGVGQGETVINSAPGFSEIQKEATRRNWSDAVKEAAIKRMIAVDPLEAQKMLGVAQPGSSAAGLLKRFEGFIATPKFDVNADRVGYGSDTVTLADGTVKRVTKDMVVTKADADRDLARRIPEFQSGIVRDVGADAWGKMSPNAQAALTSVSYNYGSLPKNVAAAVKTGDANAVASSVADLQGHNGGINASRRRQEAEIIRAGGGVADGISVPGDPSLDDMSFAKRTALYAQAGQAAQVEKYEVNKMVTDDLISLKATGQGSAALTSARVAKTLGPAAETEWLDKRDFARSVYQATAGFDQMPNEDINASVDRVRPVEGAADYVRQSDIYRETHDKAQAILAQRAADPAQAVDASPSVVKARARLSNEKSVEAREALVDARLAVQASLGIPSYNRSPITVEEAKEYATKMRPLARGQADVANQDQVIQGVVKEINDKYGRYGGDVLQRTLYQVTLKKDASEVLADAMQRMHKTDSGPLVTTDNARKMQTANAADDMAKAGGADPYAGFDGAPQFAPAPVRQPFDNAISDLRKDPEKLLPMFIKRFGVDRVPPDLRSQVKGQSAPANGKTTVDANGESWSP